jgi:hypothetical protein
MTLFQLATRKRHTWSLRLHVPSDPSTGEAEQFIRLCSACALSRITIISNTRGPRLYRWPDGIAFECDVEPECGAMAAAKGQAA